jgi:hypothetical protein
MFRALVLVLLLAPVSADAQTHHRCTPNHPCRAPHARAVPAPARPVAPAPVATATPTPAAAPAPVAVATPEPPHVHTMPAGEMSMAPEQAGQSAFAAIQEIVVKLQADPKTDWSKVNIDALRQHLVDMNNVTLSANVRSMATEDGLRFEITGDGPVRDSIRRMVTGHAATMNGGGSWLYEASEIDGGATLTVHTQPQDREKLGALGFFGLLTLGAHHQLHHLKIARGEALHE